MADRFWIAGTAANWNDTANWSTSSGGAGGASVPIAVDLAIFDGNGLGNCNLAARDMKGSVEVRSGGDITFTGSQDQRDLSVDTITVKSGGVFRLGAAFGQFRCDGCTWVVESGGSVIAPAGSGIQRPGTINCAGTWSVSQTLYHVNLVISQAMTFGGDLIRTTAVASNGTITFPTGLTIIQGDFEINGSTARTVDLATNNGSLEITGDVITAAVTITWSKGTGTITLSGTGNQDIDFDGLAVEDIEIDKTAGTVTLSTGIETDSLTITDGTLDIDAQTVDVVGAMTVAAGCTVQDTTGGGIINVGGNFAINGSSGNEVTWDGPDLDITGTAAADYAIVSDSDASAGTNVTATNSTDSGGNSGWNFGAAAMSRLLNLRRRAVLAC